jgi:hypothetical protein
VWWRYITRRGSDESRRFGKRREPMSPEARQSALCGVRKKGDDTYDGQYIAGRALQRLDKA